MTELHLCLLNGLQPSKLQMNCTSRNLFLGLPLHWLLVEEPLFFSQAMSWRGGGQEENEWETEQLGVEEREREKTDPIQFLTR